MDLFPAIVALCAADPPADRVIDGLDRVFLSNLAEDAREIRNLAGREPQIAERLRQWELDVQSGG